MLQILLFCNAKKDRPFSLNGKQSIFYQAKKCEKSEMYKKYISD